MYNTHICEISCNGRMNQNDKYSSAITYNSHHSISPYNNIATITIMLWRKLETN